MKSIIIVVFALLFVPGMMSAQSTKTVDVEQSSVTWTGKKVTGSHTGSIKLTEGNLEFASGRLSGGSFTIDMTSITNSDLDGDMKGKLEGHLKSDDFFGVENHPTATLKITKVGPGDGGYKVWGDLTIKGKTASVGFNASVNGSSAQANITVDRTIYDVRYGSGKFFEDLGDRMIYDDFDLVVNLVLK